MKRINKKNSKVILFGGKIIGKLMSETLIEQELYVDTVFDRKLESIFFDSKPRFINDLYTLSKIIKNFDAFLLGIGGHHGYMRVKLGNALQKLDLRPLNVFQNFTPKKNNLISDGVTILEGAIMQNYTQILEYSIININVTIDHDCIIGKGVHLMPGCVLAGNVCIGDYSTVGSNATILPNLKIGKHAYIGAGSVVTKDVNDYDIVVGNPAKFFKKNQIDIDKLLINKLENIYIEN